MNTFKSNTISVKLIGGEEAEVVADVMEGVEGVTIDDSSGTYLAIETESKELLFDMPTIEADLGRPYSVSSFLAIMSTYKGYIEVNDDNVLIKQND